METIKIGGFAHIKAVTIGGDSPVTVQTMWKEPLSHDDLTAAAQRIEALSKMGCALVRFAVPNLPAAQTLGRLAGLVSMPLAADIHFDHTIALRCLDYPIAKIRINPGNIGHRDKVRAVLEKASEKGVPIRIGVNAGSLPQDLRQHPAAEALVETALRELAVFDEFGFENVLISMKASGIADTIRANRILAQRVNVPLHIGITEAGPLVAGVARSSAALSQLLAEGIGDTIRVSLSDSMEQEIIAAREICSAAAELASLEGRRADRFAIGSGANGTATNGVRIVSCPRCGRYGFDTHGFTSRWMTRLYALEKNITVAIMGCEVNGPEEARHADLGITGTGKTVLIFRYGTVVRTVSIEEADDAFAEELELVQL
ncbi:MAG: (E)-4-hydroxy-3-methylbut-2-enyl-diphosphate synthase [Treponema sp.]|nr:(E)-4-hydroxy-3-methylbut-2-enyl-diphosphate synthase [Treponema sp.]